MLTQERLKELLHYDQTTGVFTWKSRMTSNVPAGSVAGHLRKDGYIFIRINKKQYSAHRLAWLYVYGKWPFGVIDHRFHKTTDNRIAELRDVTQSANLQNKHKAQTNNILGLLGVSFDKRRKKFCARITINGKQKWLGSFNTTKEAYDVYIDAKRRSHQTCTI